MTMPAIAEQDHNPVEEQVIACVAKHAGSVAASTIVRELVVADNVSEKEIKKALRMLLQSGYLRMGRTMNLEVAE